MKECGGVHCLRPPQRRLLLLLPLLQRLLLLLGGVEEEEGNGLRLEVEGVGGEGGVADGLLGLWVIGCVCVGEMGWDESLFLAGARGGEF